MPENEINDTMEAIKQALDTGKANTLPELVSYLMNQSKDWSEDAIRIAFWYLVGEGAVTVNDNFQAVLAEPAVA